MKNTGDYLVLRRTWRHRIKMSLRGCTPKPALKLCLFEEEFCISLFGFLIALPFLDRWVRQPHECMESWGVYYMDRRLCWTWGTGHWSLRMPWDYEHIKHEVQRPDGSWVPYVASYEQDKEPDGRWQGTYPYHYLLLPSGEVQHAQATIYVDRREWRQRWLKWCSWFAKVRQSISINFDREMGERAGSWKGGVIGAGYDMRPGETAEETLRRMQREHRFDR